MRREERYARETHFATGARAISVVFAVGVVVLLTPRAPLHLTEAYVLSAPTAVERSDVEAPPVAFTLSAAQSEAAARAAKQDDPPVSTF
jgi:hypothetical protein